MWCYGSAHASRVLGAADAYWVRVVDPDRTVADAIARCVATGSVLAAERHATGTSHQPAPNDPPFPGKWDHLNVG